MNDKEHLELNEVLDRYGTLKDELQKKPTLFEIAGFPSRENVFSNVLTFYLDSRRPHGLSCTVLRCLLHDLVSDAEDLSLETIAIKREATTENYKRIDIVIETSKYIIGIENKVYHILNNDLIEYADYLQKNYPTKKVIKIVLALYPSDSLSGDFVSLTYADFIKQLQKIDSALQPQNIYHIFLKDFIKNIQNHLTPFDMTKEQIQFLSDNEDSIDEIVSLNKQSQVYLFNRRNRIFQALSFSVDSWNGSVYDYQITLVRKLDNELIKVYCSLEISSIYIEIDTQNSHFLQLKEYLKDHGFIETKESNAKLIIKEYVPISDFRDELVTADLNNIISLVDVFLSGKNN